MNRKPTEEHQKVLDSIELKAVESFQSGNLQKSHEHYQEMLDSIFEAQQKENRAIHKGLPLHMMGVIHLLQKEENQALKYFLLAYVEDTLTAPLNKEEQADTAPAYHNIINVLAFDFQILEKIKNISKDKKKKKIEIYHPEVILKELGLNVNNLLRYKVVDFPSFKEKRVFIGGDYLVNSENIHILEKYVLDVGFYPIIPYYIQKVPEDAIYDFSLLCLRNCKYAIFSVIHGGGHYFEIDKCKDKEYGIEPLLLVHRFRDEYNKTDKLSGMITSIGYSIVEYSDPFEELRLKVKKYLGLLQ